MPVIEIEASRVVRYSKNVEVTDEQAATFRRAFESGDKREVQASMEEWIDTRYDVVDADEYDIMNALVDDEQLAA